MLIEGPLRKKNSKGIGRVFSGFRTRYFVLDAHDAVMYYFESTPRLHAPSFLRHSCLDLLRPSLARCVL